MSVVVVARGGDGLHDGARMLLERAGHEVTVARAASEQEMIDAVRDADGIIFGGPISRRVMESLTRCRVLARTGIGMDGVEAIDVATERGIVLCNMPGVIEEEVADQTLALLLGVTRWVVPFDRFVRDGGWSRREVFPDLRIPRLRGSVLGLVGLGRIGQAVAQRAVGFGMRLLAHDPVLPDAVFSANGIRRATLAEVLQDSDIVSLHVPLAPDTHHLIGEAELRLMRPHAVLINTCRGQVVDEVQLIRALREGWIAGAGLDVMESEPIAGDHPLCALSNVLLSPHCASRSEFTDDERQLRPAQEVAAVLAGRRPRAVWNPEVLDRVSLS